MSRVIGIAVVLVAVSHGAAASVTGAGLTRKDNETLDSVSVAYFRGDAAAAVRVISPLTARMTDERVQLFDQALVDRGMPTLGRLLGDARLALVEQGLAKKLPKLKLKEALLVLPALAESAAQLRRPAADVAAIPDPPVADSVERYEEWLWSLHVQRNRLDSARRVGIFAAQLAKTIPKSHLAKVEPEDSAVVERDYAAMLSQTDEAIADLGEQELDLRLRRLELAEKVLEQKQLTPQRFFAAYTWQLDAARLATAFEPGNTPGKKPGKNPGKSAAPPKFKRESLNRAALPAETAARAERCREKAGELSQKAIWLFEGLHWWLRGRYGAGPDVWGLAKSQESLGSLESLFPLFMPAGRPKPTAPGETTADAVPYCDRRHHYWWAWEDRRVDTATFSDSNSSTSYQDWCAKGYFW